MTTNVERYREALEAWNRRDLVSILELASPDLEFHTAQLFPGIKPIYRGRDGLVEFWTTFIEEPWALFRLDIDELHAAEDDRVLALLTFTGTGARLGGRGHDPLRAPRDPAGRRGDPDRRVRRLGRGAPRRRARRARLMADPLELRAELDDALELAASEARAYLEALPREPVLRPGAAEALEGWEGELPEDGDGALAALGELSARARESATRSSGPRFFHFVIGGGTPAALGADWLTSAYDQNGYAWASSPLAVHLERVATRWLAELFELGDAFAGTLVTGATAANLTGLAAARNWYGERHGADVDAAGLAGLPAPTVLSSGYLHPSAVQALAMLGIGRDSARRLTADDSGRLDLAALERELAAAEHPIVIANAGEVNAGEFDPIAEVAELARAHGAWLHVDGAFGLFARVAPESRELVAGVELADSIAADAHKWLNVPYDCGFAFVREPARLAAAFNVGAPYLPAPDDPRPNFGFLTPENSRRARALSVWATLRAYGRQGYRAMVERHLALARRLAARVDAEDELERLAEVKLNIVCFRARPEGVAEDDLDRLNAELGAALLADGRVFCGTTTYRGRTAFRPAIVNWQTTEPDVDALVDVVLELLAERR